MKLLYCPKCEDIVGLRWSWCSCECGKSKGRYVNVIDAELSGDAIPLGIPNTPFEDAIHNRPDEGQGSTFTAFVIPKECPTVRYINKKEVLNEQ